jgi:hypothetical protein
MSARRACDEEEKLDQTALTASRSSTGKASRDYFRGVSFSAGKQREGACLLQLQIGAFVCHSLVTNAEFTRWRALGRRR